MSSGHAQYAVGNVHRTYCVYLYLCAYIVVFVSSEYCVIFLLLIEQLVLD